MKCCDSVVIYGISVNFKKDPNSTKWMICHPLKNFGADYYTNEYGIEVNVGGFPTAQAAGSCLNSPPDDTTTNYEYNVAFTDPTRTLTHGTPPTACTSTTDLSWEIPYADHFSFEIYGAADSTAANDGDADGMDIFLDFRDYSQHPNTTWQVMYHATDQCATCTTIYPCTD